MGQNYPDISVLVTDEKSATAAPDLAASLRSRYRLAQVSVRSLLSSREDAAEDGASMHSIVLLNASAPESFVRLGSPPTKGGAGPDDDDSSSDAGSVSRFKAPTGSIGAWVCPGGCTPPNKVESLPVDRVLDHEITVRDSKVDSESVERLVEALGSEFKLTERALHKQRRLILKSSIVMFLAAVATVFGVFSDVWSLLGTSGAETLPTVSAQISYSESDEWNDNIDLRRGRQDLPLTVVRQGPFVGDEIALTTQPPPEGWVAYGLVLFPDGALWSEPFFLVDNEGNQDTDVVWPIPSELSGTFTALVVLLPNTVSLDEWNDAFEATKVALDGVNIGAMPLPPDIRLVWNGTDFEQVEIDPDHRGGSTLTRGNRTSFQTWARVLGDHVRMLDEPFVWSGQSFTVQPVPWDGTASEEDKP